MGAVPRVAIHVAGPLRVYCGGKTLLEVAAGTVQDLLHAIERDYPAFYCNVCEETGRVRRHLNVFVNSDNIIDGAGVATRLAAGDVVTFLPAVSGG